MYVCMYVCRSPNDIFDAAKLRPHSWIPLKAQWATMPHVARFQLYSFCCCLCYPSWGILGFVHSCWCCFSLMSSFWCRLSDTLTHQYRYQRLATSIKGISLCMSADMARPRHEGFRASLPQGTYLVCYVQWTNECQICSRV